MNNHKSVLEAIQSLRCAVNDKVTGIEMAELEPYFKAIEIAVAKPQRLWVVKLKGMQSSSTGAAYGNCYVLADDATAAAQKVIDYVNDRDLGFSHERVLDRVILVAETGDYPDCRCQIHL